jgi:phage-related protein
VKLVTGLGDAKEQISAFPDPARTRAGFELWEVQQGKDPTDWKPMPSIGIGVNGIRVRAGGAYRVLYLAKFAEAVYVLHAFEKKTPRTAREDVALARARYRAMLKERKQK